MMLFARFVSFFLYRLKMPRILGDLIGACLLGPTVLQAYSACIFPSIDRDTLKMVGNLGLIFSSVANGGNLDVRIFKGRATKVVGYALFNFGTAFGSAYGALSFLPVNSNWVKTATYNPTAYALYFAIIIGTSSLPMTFLIIDDLKLGISFIYIYMYKALVYL